MAESALRLFDEELQKPELSLAPMVDMIFILIIFFAIATTFTRHKGIQVEKSHAESATQLRDQSVMITIDREGRYWFEGEARPLEQIGDMILAKVASTGKSPNAILIPDKNGRVDPLIRAMDHLRMRKIDNFSLGTEPRERPGFAENETTR